jgi:hypothetical protein
MILEIIFLVTAIVGLLGLMVTVVVLYSGLFYMSLDKKWLNDISVRESGTGYETKLLYLQKVTYKLGLIRLLESKNKITLGRYFMFAIPYTFLSFPIFCFMINGSIFKVIDLIFI